MPIYVYGCTKDKEHERIEIGSSISGLTQLDVDGVYCPACGEIMQRIPQPFDFGINAQEVLTDWMDDNYRRFRAGVPRQNRWRVKRPGKPLPQTQFRSRSYKNHDDKNRK